LSKGSKNGVVDIPIYVDLKNYNGEEELERLLAYRVNEVLRPRSGMLASDLAESTKGIKGWLAQPTARFLLLFDGLNEVRPEHYTKVRHLLKAFITSQHHIVITCRESDYDESLDGRTTVLVLTPLGLNDIYDYLRRVLGDQGKQFFYEQQIISSEKMEALASNPLTLWLIAFVAKSSAEADLPTNRGRLIGRFVELMPKLRQREGIQRQVSYDIVISLLAKLAFKMQNLKRLTADLGELRQWQLPTAELQLETVLIQAKEWRFLKADGGMGEPVEFLHQLFLEYFASAYLDSELRTGMSFEEAVGDRLFSDHWVEVIVMLAGITDRPSRLVQWLSQRIREKNDWRRALLVERCWRTTAASDDAEATAAVVDSLLVPLATGESSEKGIRYRGVDPYVRQNAIRALAKIGAPAVEPLITSLKEGLGVGAGAADALREIGDKRAVKPLIMALADEDSELRQRAAVALGKFGDSRAAEPLFAALSDEDEDVRICAAEALGKIGDRDIVEPLIELLEGQGEEFSWLVDTDPDEGELEDLFLNAPLAALLIGNPLALGSDELRQLAAIALGIIGDERAIRPLLAALKYRKDPDVRWRAAEALGNLGSRQAIPKLKRAALEDESDSSWGSVADAAQNAVQKLIQVKPR
jgi:HEAT repeat protein